MNGGRFSGPELNGIVLPDGGDWPRVAQLGSIKRYQVRGQHELVLLRAEIVGGRVMGVLVPDFVAEQRAVLAPQVEPMVPADAVGGVARLGSRTLFRHVVEILVA